MATPDSSIEIEDAAPDVIQVRTWGQLIAGETNQTSQNGGSSMPTTNVTEIIRVATDYQSPNFKEGRSGWKLGSNGVIQAVGIKAQTASTIGLGSTGVIMDENGLRGYDATLGQVFNIPVDGSAPTFSSGTITNSTFEINTNAVLRTSDTVADGTANSAGVLINNTGFYGCLPNQTVADASVRLKNEGTFFAGDANNYINWDGDNLRVKGSFDVGTGGVINNAVYTVANLPAQPTTVGFNNPSANSAY